jgi:molybdate transport system substrate-binding protein
MYALQRVLCVLAVWGILGFVAVPSPASAQEKIKVLSDGPLEPALVQIGEAFRSTSGYQVEFIFGTSPVVHKKVVGGEAADVLIIQPNFMEELVKAGKVVAGEHPVIARVGIGLAARADAPARDIATPEALKQALLSADSIIYNNVAVSGSSGNHFAKVLDRLNIADTVKAKTVRVDPAAVFDRVIQGTPNDIGVGTIPLIVATKGLRLVGPLPAELQSYIVYTVAPMTSAKSPQAAKAFIGYLTTPAAKSAFAAAGVQ